MLIAWHDVPHRLHCVGDDCGAIAVVGVAVSVAFGPLPLPVYEQPPPGDGYAWTPGYWAAAREQRIAPAAAQTQHEQAARKDPSLRAGSNPGKPPIAATVRAADMHDHAVVAREAGGAYHAPATHPKDLPALEHAAPANTGNEARDRAAEQKQRDLMQKQQKEREELDRTQQQEHEHMEQRHRQQTQHMQMHHMQQRHSAGRGMHR